MKKFVVIFTAILTIGALGMFFTDKSNSEKYPWHIYETELYRSMKKYSGKDVTIAYLDSGISDDLVKKMGDRVKSGYNFIKNTSDTNDLSGHGTSVICVVACDYESTGIFGIAPKSTILPIVVLDKTGYTNAELVAKGIDYAVDNNVDIINISLGSKTHSDEVDVAVKRAIDAGIVVIASAGDNDDDKILYPAKYNGVIAVQAQSILGSEYMYASTGDEVDILLPGESIKTIGVSDTHNQLMIKYEDGSSLSAAIMSGVAALMISKYGSSITVTDLHNYIREITIGKNKYHNIHDIIMKY